MKPLISVPGRQRGAVLVVSLMLLLALTLLVLANMGVSNLNLLIVGNMQAQQQAQMHAQRHLEHALGDARSFSDPASAAGSWQLDDGYTVVVEPPRCLEARPAEGYSLNWELTPERTTWELAASASDAASGARAALRQGVEIQMIAGQCH